MEAKTNGRITIKMLSEHFDKEMKIMKETIISLEKRLNDSDNKVKSLEEKFPKKEEAPKNSDKVQKECKICQQIFESRKSLKSHIKVCHPAQIKCVECEKTFNINADLEMHIEEYHEKSEQHKCNQCGKNFVLKWRLKKHLEAHSNGNNRFCHFFNNGKTCPYEKIGCKFLHQPSATCYFGEKCKNELCQYKHFVLDNDSDEMESNDLKNNFNKLTEMEKEETKEVFCDIYCNRGYDCHICSDEGFEALIGCDVKNITDEFDDDDEEADPVTKFPCDGCSESFDNCEMLKTHHTKNHKSDKTLKCAFKECNFSTKIIDVLIMHIGVEHLDYVRRKGNIVA